MLGVRNKRYKLLIQDKSGWTDFLTYLLHELRPQKRQCYRLSNKTACGYSQLYAVQVLLGRLAVNCFCKHEGVAYTIRLAELDR